MNSPSSAQRSSSENRRRNVAYALSAIVVVMIVGTIGFHDIEGMSWMNAIYFESMLATGQRPPIQLTTDAGKIFASIMAFVSVGSVISALAVTLIPIISQLCREGLEKVEEDAKGLERKTAQKKEKLEESQQ